MNTKCYFPLLKNYSAVALENESVTSEVESRITAALCFFSYRCVKLPDVASIYIILLAFVTY